MIAVDLDGTLLNSRKRIAEEDRAALVEAAARGVEIVPVTGRNYSTALPIVAELLAGGPLIASNGAIIRSREGETHLRGLLPAAVAVDVLRVTPEFRHYTVLTYDQHGEGQFRIEIPGSNGNGNAGPLPADSVAASPWIARYKAAVRFTDSLEREMDDDPVEIMFAGPVRLMREVEARLAELKEAADAADRMARRFRLLRTEYPERNFSIVDVIRHDCSKGHAVEFWSRYRGFAREEVMAIGDNYNDLEMLRFAGTPVVMGNAEEAVKQEGGQEGWATTLDCDSGGVARAVERFVLAESSGPAFRNPANLTGLDDTSFR
jgi:hydroxymethylpyrimidine pyrophosphatase-like HAD family hydrolase